MEHIKENWEAIKKLQAQDIERKASYWDNATGKILALILVAVASAILSHIPTILSWFQK